MIGSGGRHCPNSVMARIAGLGLAHHIAGDGSSTTTDAMSDQGLPIIDRTVQETNRWLNALMEDTGQSDKTFALAGLRGGHSRSPLAVTGLRQPSVSMADLSEGLKARQPET